MVINVRLTLERGQCMAWTRLERSPVAITIRKGSVV
jgi:hypothetical protein